MKHVLSLLVLVALSTQYTFGQTVYQDDPEITTLLTNLKPGESALLPEVKHKRDGKEIDGRGRLGPFARDYTNKMVYAKDRKTALYAGGNHGMGRTNDVWEYHLGSNTWHSLHPADGGDHARFKFALMFYPPKMMKDPSAELTEKQQTEVENCKAWWKENVVLKDGNFVMKETGAPLLSGHTWDTLMYDPVNRRMVHGTGAHCANTPWLEHQFNDRPLAEVEAQFGKRADGVPWRRPWTFDPSTGRWSPYANHSPLASMRGMGGSLLALGDAGQAVWYYCGQNTPGAPHVMCLWDLKTDVWTELRPNDGQKISTLGLKLKQAPECEQQMVYAEARRKIVAVEERSTFLYDFESNQWSRANEAVPFHAHDAHTVFAYDTTNDQCLLADPRKNLLASYDLATNAWRTLTPTGPGLPKPPYCVGRGYFDPDYCLFVVQSAYTNRVWVYRPTPTPAVQ